SSSEHRMAVLGLVAAMHTAPPAARRRALADDFLVPHRDELEAACQPAGGARPGTLHTPGRTLDPAACRAHPAAARPLRPPRGSRSRPALPDGSHAW
ncbi:MAG: hypothetical protein ACR2MP_16025, partial [Streptosporangiaceae bacterium]